MDKNYNLNFMEELKLWFSWYDDEDIEQFHYDYFRHYELTK